MLAVDKIAKAQQKNRSYICLGLDLDPKKMPKDYTGSTKGMFDFVQAVVEATSDQVCAYKPNLAFYESLGSEGLSLLQLIIERIPDKIPIILDGKRNDIGNTASQYASAMYDYFKADWVTINPYMGYDSMRPFLDRKDRGAFVLCLTSNVGSKDFQELLVEGRPLYEIVADRVRYWNKDNNCGLVVGATHPEQLADIRALAGDMPLLIPGVGAQGGSLEKAVLAGTNNFKQLAVINVSRSVLYASNGADFAQRARLELVKLNAAVTKIRYEDPSSDVSHPDQARSQQQQHQQQHTPQPASAPPVQPQQPEQPEEPQQPASATPNQPAPGQRPAESQPDNQSSDQPPSSPEPPQSPPPPATNGPN